MSAQTRQDVENGIQIVQLRVRLAALEVEMRRLARLTESQNGITAEDVAEGERRTWAAKAQQYPAGSLLPMPSARNFAHHTEQAHHERFN
jgi:hypothetical protein